MKILRPQPRPIAFELAFYQDHKVPCMHIKVPESLLHSFPHPPAESTGFQEPK